MLNIEYEIFLDQLSARKSILLVIVHIKNSFHLKQTNFYLSQTLDSKKPTNNNVNLEALHMFAKYRMLLLKLWM